MKTERGPKGRATREERSGRNGPAHPAVRSLAGPTRQAGRDHVQSDPPGPGANTSCVCVSVYLWLTTLPSVPSLRSGDSDGARAAGHGERRTDENRGTFLPARPGNGGTPVT